MSKITAKVTQGQVTVSYVDIRVRRPNLIVIEIGTSTKYPDVLGYSSLDLVLQASDASPDANRELPGTMVSFTLPPGDWQVLPEYHGRYSITVVFWKENNGERKTLWECREENEAGGKGGKK